MTNTLKRLEQILNPPFFILQQELITYFYFHWANLGTDTIGGPSVTECKMLTIRTVLHLIC